MWQIQQSCSSATHGPGAVHLSSANPLTNVTRNKMNLKDGLQTAVRNYIFFTFIFIAFYISESNA